MGYKLDIACGHQVQPGCIGIDLERRGNVIQRDVRRGLPFADDTVSEIYLNHALEHFRTGDELWFLISEMYRVMHDGAKLRIRVPHSDTTEAKHPSHLSEWNEFAIVCFEPDGAPSPYTWNFSIESKQRSGIELQAVLRCRKKQFSIRPEAGCITIITAVFNQLHHTKRFIQSIRRNTTNPYQIIVVNNASTDGTFEWLEQQSDLVAITLDENKGWVGAINVGLSWLEGAVDKPDFVIFANNDVVIDGPGWERRLLGHFDDTVGAVGPTSNYVAGRQNIVHDHEGIHEEETEMLVGFFLCVRYSVALELGPLDDLHSFRQGSSLLSGGDDFDYSIRIRDEAGLRLVIARDVYVYHAGSQSIRAELNLEEYFKLCGDADKALERKWGTARVARLGQSPVRVLCCVPMRSDYNHRTFTFTFSTMRKPFHFQVADIPRAHIDTARNAAVKEAKRLKMDYLMFLDDDHRIPPDTFLRLHRMDVPVASALAFQRVPPFGPCIYRWVMKSDDGRTAAVPLDGLIRKGQRMVDCTGFSAVLIRMEVFDKIGEDAWFEWRTKEFGEDFDFCLKCKDAGIPIYCDTDLILPHLGDSIEVDENTFYAYNPEAAKAGSFK